MNRLKWWLMEETPIGSACRALASIFGPPLLTGFYFGSWELGLSCFLLQMYFLILCEVYGFKPGGK